jgi:5-methylcytosine-specific restriction endonuclease McrA
VELVVGLTLFMGFILWLGAAVQQQTKQEEKERVARRRQQRKEKLAWEAGADARAAEAVLESERQARVAAWEAAWGNPDKPSWAALTLKERRSLIKRKVEDLPEPFQEFELGITQLRIFDELWQQKRRRPRCYLCRKFLSKPTEYRGKLLWRYGEAAHIDHIVPLAEGGTHTRDNVTLVHASCNLNKRAALTDILPGKRGPLPADHRLGFTPVDFPPKHLRRR